MFWLFEGGEEVGEGAGDGAGEDAAVVAALAVDVLCVQFVLQGFEAAVAAHEDLDVARRDAGAIREAGDEGGDGVGFAVLVGAAVRPLHRARDGAAVGGEDGLCGVGRLGFVVGDVRAEAGIVVLQVVFVQRGDEVGAAAAVGVEAVLFVGAEAGFEAVVVGDVAAAEAVYRLFRVADEEEEAVFALAVFPQVGALEQGGLFVVQILGFVHEHDGVTAGEVVREVGAVLRVGKGFVDACGFFAEGGFAARFQRLRVGLAHGFEEAGDGLAFVVVEVVLSGVARGEEVADEEGEGVGGEGCGERGLFAADAGFTKAAGEGFGAVVKWQFLMQLLQQLRQRIALFVPGGVFGNGGGKFRGVNHGLPVGNHRRIKFAQLPRERLMAVAAVVGRGIAAVDCGMAVAGRLTRGGEVGVAVVIRAVRQHLREGFRVVLVVFVQEAAQGVVDGFFQRRAVFVDLQAFVVARFQRKFRQPALAEAVDSADEQLVQPRLQAFDAAENGDEAVQPMFCDRVQDEVAVDEIAAAAADDVVQAGREAVVIIQYGFFGKIARGDGFQVFAQSVQALVHALLHFRRCLAGEGGGDDFARRVAAFDEQAQDDAGERPSFAGTGGGFDEGAAFERDFQSGGGFGRGVHAKILPCDAFSLCRPTPCPRATSSGAICIRATTAVTSDKPAAPLPGTRAAASTRTPLPRSPPPSATATTCRFTCPRTTPTATPTICACWITARPLPPVATTSTPACAA